MYPSFCLPIWVNNWQLFHSLNLFFPALRLLFVLKRQKNCIMLLHLKNMLNRRRTQEGLRTQLLVILLPKNHIKLTAGHYLEFKIELQCRCWTMQKWIQYVWDEIHCGEKVLSDVWYGHQVAREQSPDLDLTWCSILTMTHSDILHYLWLCLENTESLREEGNYQLLHTYPYASIIWGLP